MIALRPEDKAPAGGRRHTPEHRFFVHPTEYELEVYVPGYGRGHLELVIDDVWRTVTVRGTRPDRREKDRIASTFEVTYALMDDSGDEGNGNDGGTRTTMDDANLGRAWHCLSNGILVVIIPRTPSSPLEGGGGTAGVVGAVAPREAGYRLMEEEVDDSKGRSSSSKAASSEAGATIDVESQNDEGFGNAMSKIGRKLRLEDEELASSVMSSSSSSCAKKRSRVACHDAKPERSM